LIEGKLECLETEKSREHDCHLTGFDYLPKRGYMVTSDTNGAIRIWNKEKKFLREIQFPNTVDSICFLNERGDLLVSHDTRLSHIKFEAYWTRIFDYYGITNTNERDFEHADEHSVYS